MKTFHVFHLLKLNEEMVDINQKPTIRKDSCDEFFLKRFEQFEMTTYLYANSLKYNII